MRSKSTRARLPGQPQLDGKVEGIKEPSAPSNKITVEVLPSVREAIQVAELDTGTRIGSDTEGSMRREADKAKEKEEIFQNGKQESRVAIRLLSVPVGDPTVVESKPQNLKILESNKTMSRDELMHRTEIAIQRQSLGPQGTKITRGIPRKRGLR